MTQETISRAELDADQARQEATFTTQVYQLAAGLQDHMHQLRTDVQADIHQLRTDLQDQMNQLRTDLQAEIHQVRTDVQAEINQLRAEIHQFDRRMMGLERRIYLVIALATGLIIGAMQLD